MRTGEGSLAFDSQTWYGDSTAAIFFVVGWEVAAYVFAWNCTKKIILKNPIKLIQDLIYSKESQFIHRHVQLCLREKCCHLQNLQKIVLSFVFKQKTRKKKKRCKIAQTQTFARMLRECVSSNLDISLWDMLRISRLAPCHNSEKPHYQICKYHTIKSVLMAICLIRPVCFWTSAAHSLFNQDPLLNGYLSYMAPISGPKLTTPIYMKWQTEFFSSINVLPIQCSVV